MKLRKEFVRESHLQTFANAYSYPQTPAEACKNLNLEVIWEHWGISNTSGYVQVVGSFYGCWRISPGVRGRKTRRGAYRLIQPPYQDVRAPRLHHIRRSNSSLLFPLGQCIKVGGLEYNPTQAFCGNVEYVPTTTRI